MNHTNWFSCRLHNNLLNIWFNQCWFSYGRITYGKLIRCTCEKIQILIYKVVSNMKVVYLRGETWKSDLLTGYFGRHFCNVMKNASEEKSPIIYTCPTRLTRKVHAPFLQSLIFHIYFCHTSSLPVKTGQANNFRALVMTLLVTSERLKMVKQP